MNIKRLAVAAMVVAAVAAAACALSTLGAAAADHMAVSGTASTHHAARQTQGATSQPATQPAAAGRPTYYTKQIPKAQLIEDFGVEEGKPIDSGFLFIEGRYIDAPYVVTRKGLEVFVNGHVVLRIGLPAREPPSGDVDPELPSKLNSTTSPYDNIYKDYIRKKTAYVQKHHTRDEERKIMAQVYASLPFVKKTELSSDGTTLKVVYMDTAGNEITDSILLAPPRRKGKFDRETLLRRIEKKRARFENSLSDGRCLFIFSGSRTTTHKGFVKSTLPMVIETLRSNLALEDKFRQLREAGLNWVKPTDASGALVTQFSASQQLEERLELLKSGMLQ